MLQRVKDYLRSRVRPLIDERRNADLSVAARFSPIEPEAANLVTPLSPPREVTDPAAFPLPSAGPMAGIEDYVELGKEHVDTLRAAVRAAGVSDPGNILDFGCGTGRMTRWLLDESRTHEVWGADFDAGGIAWDRAHLTPPFHFVTCTSLPSLPFEDGYFGLVVAGSVFTHISEMADAWLLELRRVTRPGGLLYLTVQDGAFIEHVAAETPDGWVGQLIAANRSLLDELGVTAESVAIGRRGNDAMVFHDRASLLRRWSAHLDVVDVVERAFYAQTAIVLRKRLPLA